MKCVSPTPISKMGGRLVSCGQCYGCRYRKKRDWAIRLQHESEMHKESCFVTLTFNQENLPKDKSLNKKFISSFLKTLREDMRRLKLPKFRHFTVGEYGSICMRCGKGKKHCHCTTNTIFITGRPHYHLIIFGYDFADKNKLLEITPAGHYLYEGNYVLQRNWKYGYATVGSVTIDSTQYVSHYALKKQDKLNYEQWKKENPTLEPEFAIQSRGGRSKQGGIGHGYYEKYLKPTYNEAFGVEFKESTHFKDIKVSLPKYYREKNRQLRKFLPKQQLKTQLEIRDNNKENSERIIKKAKKAKRSHFDVYWEEMAQIQLNAEEKNKIYERDGKI